LFENHNNIKITLPIKNSHQVGLRKPVTTQVVETIKIFLSQKIDGAQVNGQEVSLPNLRNKIATGDPQKVAEAIRDLHAKITQDGGKYANPRRKSFLQEAKRQLAREISISTGLTIKQVSTQIYSILED
jgi:RNA polymerase-interacting CarD/CdnL/TRCF family regulator